MSFKKGDRVTLVVGHPFGPDLTDLTVVGYRQALDGRQLVAVEGRDWDGRHAKLYAPPYLLTLEPT